MQVGGYHQNDPGFKVQVVDEFVTTKNHLTEAPCSPIETFYKYKNYLTTDLRREGS